MLDFVDFSFDPIVPWISLAYWFHI